MGSRRALGVLAVLLAAGACAKESSSDAAAGAGAGPRANEDHWHAAFGIYVCGEFQDDLPESESPEGIHTHGDGVIHIHPFSRAGAGSNANLDTFLDSTDVELDAGSLGGDECDGVLQIAVWDDLGGEPRVTGDPAEARFTRDEQAVTIAVVPEGEDIPLPPSTDDLDELGGVDMPSSPTTTRPPGPTPTVDAAGDMEDGFYPVVIATPLDESCVAGLGVVPGRDGTECYVVDLSTALSTDIIESAEHALTQGQEQISLVLTEDGVEAFNGLAADCYNASDPLVCPTGRVAIVVDGEVISAPTIVEPSFERDEISISGNDLVGIAEALDP